MRQRRGIGRGEDGFTLLEVLVAFVLLAGTVTVIFQLFSANLKVISLSEDYALAAVKAEAKMREVLDKEDLSEGSWSESMSEGYTVQVTVTNVYDVRTRDLPVRVLEVNLIVLWKKGEKEKTMALRTMKMVKAKV